MNNRQRNILDENTKLANLLQEQFLSYLFGEKTVLEDPKRQTELKAPPIQCQQTIIQFRQSARLTMSPTVVN